MVKIQPSKQVKKDSGIRAKDSMKALETMPAKKSAIIKIYKDKYQVALSLLGKVEGSQSHKFFSGDSWPYPWIMSNILPMLSSISNHNAAVDTSACTTIF